MKDLVFHAGQQSHWHSSQSRPMSIPSQKCRISSQTCPQKLPSISPLNQSSSPRGSASSANACKKHVVLKGSTPVEASNQSAKLSFSYAHGPRPSLCACVASMCCYTTPEEVVSELVCGVIVSDVRSEDVDILATREIARSI